MNIFNDFAYWLLFSAILRRSLQNLLNLAHKKEPKGLPNSFIQLYHFDFFYLSVTNKLIFFLILLSRKMESLEVSLFFFLIYAFTYTTFVVLNVSFVLPLQLLMFLKILVLFKIQALKKTFRKLDHDVKIQDFLGSR